MSKRHRGQQLQRATPSREVASASGWGWRGGTAPLFDGSKFRGALRAAYPAGYDLDYATLRGLSTGCTVGLRARAGDHPTPRGQRGGHGYVRLLGPDVGPDPHYDGR